MQNILAFMIRKYELHTLILMRRAGCWNQSEEYHTRKRISLQVHHTKRMN